MSISNATLSSKVLSSLPLTWRAQIRHYTDSGMATQASIEKSLCNIQAEQKNIGSKPASRAFAISKKNNKDKCHKNQDGHGKKDKKGLHNTTNLQCQYCTCKGYTRDNYSFKKVIDKLREKDTNGKKPAFNPLPTIIIPQANSMPLQLTMTFPKVSVIGLSISELQTICAMKKGSFITFYSLDHLKPIYLGNSSTVNAYGIGSVQIGDRVSLFNILHILNLDINLLSVEKILQCSYNVLFFGDSYMIR